MSLCKKAFQRIPSQQQVEEIVQDVFVNLWVKAATLDKQGNVRAYLYATLRNKILHELRTEANRSFYMDKLKKLKRRKEGEECLYAIYRKETEECINRIIMSLSPQCRKAFKLSRFEQLSYKEIAERMQISVSTVEKHVSKVLSILKAELGKEGQPFLVLLVCMLLH